MPRVDDGVRAVGVWGPHPPIQQRMHGTDEAAAALVKQPNRFGGGGGGGDKWGQRTRSTNTLPAPNDSEGVPLAVQAAPVRLVHPSGHVHATAVKNGARPREHNCTTPNRIAHAVVCGPHNARRRIANAVHHSLVQACFNQITTNLAAKATATRAAKLIYSGTAQAQPRCAERRAHTTCWSSSPTPSQQPSTPRYSNFRYSGLVHSGRGGRPGVWLQTIHVVNPPPQPPPGPPHPPSAR
jgi:hypothetical protein